MLPNVHAIKNGEQVLQVDLMIIKAAYSKKYNDKHNNFILTQGSYKLTTFQFYTFWDNQINRVLSFTKAKASR